MSSDVLVVDDEIRYRDLYTRTLESIGLPVRTASSAEEALAQIVAEPPGLVVSDVRMPGESGIELLRSAREKIPELPFLLVTAYADVRDAVTALKLGAVDYLAKPVDLDELIAAVEDALHIRSKSQHSAIPPEALTGIVAESPVMEVVLLDAYRVAQSDATILLTGESGTGKEVIARFIHEQSKRKEKPFVPVNCGAVPETLIASALFGHIKGSFTGATENRDGYFREADTGTLFLDEIADMPLDIQPSLLRAIETRRIMPVGTDREVDTDFRLIAATNSDLHTEMEQDRFREDLFYRINVIAINLPPLREHREDILPLARSFLAQSNSPKQLSRAVSSILMEYEWPGNIRELENALERATLMSTADMILPEHLPHKIAESVSCTDQDKTEEETLQEIKTLEQSEIETIKKALKKTEGNRTKAAELLGITRRGLIYKLKRLKLE
ncbi:sigma-54-dependent transcriptional regulator [Planctomycetota bacterium]